MQAIGKSEAVGSGAAQGPERHRAAPIASERLTEALYDYVRLIKAREADEVRGFGRVQIDLMVRLDRVGPERLTALAEALGADLSVVSRQVMHLVDKGLVVRRPDPTDGRACLVAITELGQSVVTDFRERRLSWLRRTLGHWSDADVETAADIVGALVVAVRDAGPDRRARLEAEARNGPDGAPVTATG